jgi:hypothetical protein
LKHNVDLAALDFKQRTPLRYLYLKKNKSFEFDFFEPLQTLKILLTPATAQSFSPNLQDISGKSFLHVLAQRGAWETFEYLITLYGKDELKVNQTDYTGNTVLAVAI